MKTDRDKLTVPNISLTSTEANSQDSAGKLQNDELKKCQTRKFLMYCLSHIYKCKYGRVKPLRQFIDYYKRYFLATQKVAGAADKIVLCF